VSDADGHTAAVPLTRYGVVRRPLEAYIYLRSGRDKQRFGSLSEVVLQTYTIPLADFARLSPNLDLTRVRQLRFVFDKTPAGTIILDNIGFSRMSPDFQIATDGR